MRALSAFFLFSCLLSAAALMLLPDHAQAQTAPPVHDMPASDIDASSNQRIERIHLEDGGSTIDELRVGGQTRSIHVQPKAGVAGYDVAPQDMQDRSRASGSLGSTGRRTWKLIDF